MPSSNVLQDFCIPRNPPRTQMLLPTSCHSSLKLNTCGNVDRERNASHIPHAPDTHVCLKQRTPGITLLTNDADPRPSTSEPSK